MNVFHPELQRAARSLPRLTFTPTLTRVINAVQKWRGVAKLPVVEGVTIRDSLIPGPSDNKLLRVRLYRPEAAVEPSPALLWIHGGGFIMGTPEQDEAQLVALCRDLGIIVVAVAYRLGPKHCYPAPMDDCYAALKWLHGQEDVAPTRIAIGGSSAGAGLAAGLTLLAHDRGEVRVAFQLLFYPMLDDRTALRTDIDQSPLRIWNNRSNLFGWTSYLGAEPGGGMPDYAVPARRQNLTGLPPTWIGVGTCDLFHDEDVDYARRLKAASVDCTLNVVPGAFHGFDLVCRKTAVAEDFRDSARSALLGALRRSAATGGGDVAKHSVV